MGGKYRLIAEIGRGGMGSVWRAEHLAWKAPVAIKLMTREVTERADGLLRFEREVRLAAGLRSPHVVQVLDHGIDEATQTPFIAMELLEGESLARRLKRVTHLGPSETFRIISHLVRALSRAHAAGIVHRDLKPDNIFLVQNEEESLAKVLDFGVAKWTAPSVPDTGLTRPGSVLGTPFYMSPEQIQGSADIDHRADLWSLTAIACECLTGRRPFEANDFAQLAVMLLGNTGRPLPSSLGPVPPGFDAWFLRGTAPDISQRFQTARELAQTLAAVCGVSSASWAPDSFPLTEELAGAREPTSMVGVSRTASRVSLPQGIWRRPWFKLVASTSLAALVVGGGILVWQNTLLSPAAPASGREPAAALSRPAAAVPQPAAASAVAPQRATRNAAPAVRLATQGGAEAEPPVRAGSPEGEGAAHAEPPDVASSRERAPAASESTERSRKRAKAKPKRATRARKAAASPPRARSTRPRAAAPTRNTDAPAAESAAGNLSVDGRRIRTSLTPTP